MLRHILALIGLVTLLCLIWLVSSDGLSSLAAKNALDHEGLASADRAVSLNSSNPEAYYARATLHRKNGQTAEAVKDLERAVDLKPGDYFLRIELGFTRYQAGDVKAATDDFEAAVRLAPYYAQPHWYLGNMMLQAGRLDDGFAQLRQAVKSDPSYLPDTIQRAAEALGGNPDAIVKAVGTETSDTRVTLERYFIQQNNIPAAMQLFRAGKDMPAADVRTLVSELLSAKRFEDAYEVWLVEKGINRSTSEETGSISNGGFESEIDADAIGFDWQLERRLEKVRVSRDTKDFLSGGYSLRVDYEGKSDPSNRVVSQLLLVKSNKDYRLSFAAKTNELVTGGLPLVTVTDAADGHLLVQSSVLPEGTTNWGTYEVPCRTGPNTVAVVVNIQRGNCSSSPCPAFGRAWFDDFIWQSR